MQMTLYASLALSAVILIAAALLIVRNQPSDKGLACLCETWMTAVLGGMLVLIGIAACLPLLLLCGIERGAGVSCAQQRFSACTAAPEHERHIQA